MVVLIFSGTGELDCMMGGFWALYQFADFLRE
jgi:hypothetical protein